MWARRGLPSQLEPGGGGLGPRMLSRDRACSEQFLSACHWPNERPQETPASPSTTTVWCFAFLHPLTWHIYNPAFHIGDDPTFGVKGHAGVDRTALIPNAAQYQPTREVFRVSGGYCAGGLTNTLWRRLWAARGCSGGT